LAYIEDVYSGLVYEEAFKKSLEWGVSTKVLYYTCRKLEKGAVMQERT